jgi:hypothetical protein
MADDNWYYAQNNQQLGPVTLEALRGMVASGQVGAADLVWTQGMSQWLPARSVPEVASALAGGGGGGASGAGAAGGGGAGPTMYQQPGAQPTGYPPPGAGPYSPVGYQGMPAPQVPDQSGKANTALGLGIASLPLCLCPLVGLGLGIAAIVVGNGVHEGPYKQKARWGVILGIIGIVVGLINAVFGVLIQMGKLGGGPGGSGAGF